MSNGVLMLNRKRGYTPDNKQKEVKDSSLKKSVCGIGRKVYEIYSLREARDHLNGGHCKG